jgi:hypothetical protein
VFRGNKDIFRDNLPQDASHQQDFKLTLGAESPVALYEFELREGRESPRNPAISSDSLR